MSRAVVIAVHDCHIILAGLVILHGNNYHHDDGTANDCRSAATEGSISQVYVAGVSGGGTDVPEGARSVYPDGSRRDGEPLAPVGDLQSAGFVAAACRDPDATERAGSCFATPVTQTISFEEEEETDGAEPLHECYPHPCDVHAVL